MSGVLVVDDNDKNLRLLADVLRSQGYQVVTASSGQEALQRVNEQPIKVILMDVQMPGMSGVDAMRRLKAGEHAHVPIIAVTALAMEGDAEGFLAAGFDGYLSKPVKLKTLIGEVARWFGEGA